ncbi:MAG: VOC family protein [Isosphaeraceae bacterium]
MPVNPIPEGYHSVTAYLIVDGANAAIEFYKKAFGAVELVRMDGPGGRIAHAEVRIGDSPVMLADESPDYLARGPQYYKGSPVHLMIYTEDCDETFRRAVEAGATVSRPLKDQFYGDRSGTIVDPFGHMWTIATHKEDVSPEEMSRRMNAADGHE